ncbi:MAG: saccharopine dehydrogenase C-terminal domain-containing protein [Candidatus Cloacimonadota bacterium]|nr:saccharopine dehydrogenase C-terminal domain-containing protein [Candidatus Cloacimonadota bacterium]
MKRILVLGAGLVSKPHVEYLLKQPEFQVTLADMEVKKAEQIINNHPNGKAISLNVNDDDTLNKLVAEHDLSVSLLPFIFHPKIARLCIKHKKNMVTASYISDEMRELDQEVKDAGIIILNEIGVDPGIDHMSALRVINHVKDKGGTIASFKSYCGGLPAPEANTNPWGYKFSWSPRGVIMAGKNSARYLEDGKVIDIPGNKLFAYHWKTDVPDFGKLEAYPNRDSVPYKDIYEIQDTKTMFRGTLRYPGWCITMKKIVDMGLLDDEKEYELNGKTYGEFISEFIQADEKSDLKKKLAELWKLPVDSDTVNRMEWIGLLGDEKIGLEKGSALDVFCKILLEKLKYEPAERDMLVMHHEFTAEYEDKKQNITSTMIDFGIPNGDSSMSRTVGLPAAIAVRMILNGVIKETGVHIPSKPEIYEPILNELEEMNITFKERFGKIE